VNKGLSRFIADSSPYGTKTTVCAIRKEDGASLKVARRRALCKRSLCKILGLHTKEE
jgi:hypothetical protein